MMQKGTDKLYLLQEICLQGPLLQLGTDIPYRRLRPYAHTSFENEEHDIIS